MDNIVTIDDTTVFWSENRTSVLSPPTKKVSDAVINLKEGTPFTVYTYIKPSHCTL